MKKLDVTIQLSSGPGTAYINIEDKKSGITILSLEFNAEEWGKLCLCTSTLRKTAEVGRHELIGLNAKNDSRIVWIQDAPQGTSHGRTPARMDWFREQVQRWARPGERGRPTDADNPHRHRSSSEPGPEGEDGSWRDVSYFWLEDDNGEVYVRPEDRLALLLD